MADPLPALHSHGPLVQVGIPVACASVLLLVILVPLVRLWRKTGVFGLSWSGAGAMPMVVLGLLVVGLGLIAFPLVLLLGGAEAARVWPAPGWVVALGVLLGAVGALVVAASQRWMGASWRIGIDEHPTDLVTSGPFGVSRHPIYSGILIGLLGLVLAAPSPFSAALFLLTFALVGVEARLEERHMIAIHGEDYRRYAAEVGRFLPFAGRMKRAARERGGVEEAST